MKLRVLCNNFINGITGRDYVKCAEFWNKFEHANCKVFIHIPELFVHIFGLVPNIIITIIVLMKF